MMMRSFGSFFEGRAFRIATAFAVQITGVGLSFLFSILLARLIGVAGVGLYFLAVTVVDIGATISRLGLENVGLRFASIAYSRGDRGTLAALYRRSMGLAVAAGIAIAPPIWLIVSHLPLGGDRALELRAEFPLLVLALVPLALLIIQAEFLKGIGASSIGTFAHAVVPPLLLLTGGIALWFMDAATLHGIFLTYVIVAVVSMIHAVAVWNWRLPGIWRERGAFDTRRLLRTSIPVLLVTSMNLVMGWTDILVLGIWADAKEVGIYGISMRIALLTAFVLGAINAADFGAGSVYQPRDGAGWNSAVDDGP
jgi:O-antigen/teichoic acid export membrane protein